MGGSAKTKQNSVSTYTPTPEAAGFYSDVLGQAKAAQSAYNPATAKTVAGFTAPQQQGFATALGNVGSWQPAVNQAGQMIGNAGAGINQADINAFFNPYQQDVIGAARGEMEDADAMARRQYVANQASQNALGGSGFHIGRAQLAGDQSTARARTIANLTAQGWDKALAAAQADKTRGLSAGQSMASLGQLTSQLGYNDANAQLGVGNQQQAQQQNVNDTASQNALQQQLWPMQQAQWLASIGSGIGPLTGGTTASSGTASQSQGKGIGNILGGAVTLAGMASDERVKENPVEIGRSHDGQPIYEYNYRGDPRRQIGLMAQDVEQRDPGAVTEVGGIKHVDYDRALEGAERYASGGSVEMPEGLMPWAELKPAQVRWPDAPDVRPPAQQQEGAADLEGIYKSGQKAGAGLSNIGNLISGAPVLPAASSPAGGAFAASGLQAGGGLGGLSGLASLFGFADGGMIPTPEEMQALEMVESNGRDIVNPRSGAFGPRQIMPATARDPGFGVRPLDQSITDRDARLAEQRRFSDDYYSAMLKRYGGDREAARIAYNGGPERADNWIKAGRNDAVIPKESAEYYKKIAAQLGDGGGAIVAKAVNPQVAEAAGGGEPYRSKSDARSGGMIQRIFGVDFNPLGLTEPERKALVIAGLSMMSHGDIGRGGLAGMQYLSGVEAGEREAAADRVKLAAQMRKDEADLSLRTRQVTNDERKAAADAARADRTFEYGKGKDERDAAFAREKLGAELGKPTGDMQEYDAYKRQEAEAGRTPLSFMEYQRELKAAGRPSTNVTVSGDKAGAQEMAKLHAQTYDKLRANAAGADQLIDQLGALDDAIKTGIQTGFAGEQLQYARRLGATLGISNASKAAAGELIAAITNKLALAVRSPGGEGGGMPGAMSDADREFLRDTVPGLLKTPEGNRQLIAVMRASARRHQVLHEMAIDYAGEHGGQLDAGFDKVVRDYVKSNPLSAALKQAQDTPRGVTTQTITPPIGGFRVLEVQ